MIVALQTIIYFRQSLITAIERFLGPYYRKLSLKFIGFNEDSDDEESEDHVFAEYDDEKGVVFYPPVYAQRYAAVTDCLMDERWCGNLEKVVDFGYHDMSFIKYLKDVPGIKRILGVDIETIPLRCSSDLLGSENYIQRRENPLQVTLYQGNAADPDYRLIGCDAVVAIEMIEHMLPHDLERLIHTVFGFIKPWVAIFTTPNGDFNVLFKSLEKNGLRRLDHMFEWTREQFHDWCSNIVARYPQYTVTCKGIGPGPTGTIHLGCCSQLALFVAKDYHKQADLNLNCMALVAQAPSPNNLSDMIGGWESPDTLVENNMLCIPNRVESYSELIFDQQSCMTMVITSPTFSLESMEYRDKILQCNLDSELGKNFLMFEDEVYFNILVPTRMKNCRVYEIEDVVSRLNCSTIQVKKFSKMTQNLMAKNKIDSFAHTREVVDEIRHLTKMLNLKKEHINIDVQSTWCNINWGTNAPYWNQYYKIVREYNYPFEVKTDECRILDLISDEVNKQIDTECDQYVAGNMQKLEIPMDHLMRVVEHITTDVDKVRELLEWNGYEIVDNILIHSRLIVDNMSEGTQDDWQDDTMSDRELTDVRSSSLSDGSTIVPDFYGHCLRRALDQKVRKLRNLLSADEDITTELDRVVCRLMKLALRTSKARKNPPSMNWMQCKLFDLLSLTEKAIEKRRRLLLDKTYSPKAIEYYNEGGDNKGIISLDQIQTDSTAQQIVSEYQHFDPSPGITEHELKCYQCDDFEFEDYTSVTSNEFRGYENNVNETSMKDVIANDLRGLNQAHYTEIEETHVLESTDVELVSYPKGRSMSGLISSDESTCSSSNGVESKQDKCEENRCNKLDTKYKINYVDSLNRTENKTHRIRSKSNLDIKHNPKSSKTKIYKRVSTKKSSYYNLIKIDYMEYKNYKCKERKQRKDNQNLQSNPPRPIPSTLIEFCYSQSNVKELHPPICDINKNKFNQLTHNIAAPEDSMFIGIVTEDGEEIIAMRRNFGTDPEIDLGVLESEDIMETEINVTKESFYCNLNIETETVQSQTIFLYDLNEPSTSKGVRHISADVQCGPDAITQTVMLSAATSFTKMPKSLSMGIKLEEPYIQAKINTYDFGTCTEWSDKIVTSCKKSIGIKIKDSNAFINDKIECYTMTDETESKTLAPSGTFEFDSKTETKLLKPVSNTLKINDSGSEICGSVGSFPKSPSQLVTPSKHNSDLKIKSANNEENVVYNISQASYDRPILVCGGIHVHSFREKQVSEDVVYQGEWQRKQNLLKKTVRNPIFRNNLSVPKKKKLNLKEHVGCQEIMKISKKTPISNSRCCNRKQKPLIKAPQNKNKYMSNPVHLNITKKRNDVMVDSKIIVRSHTPKTMKTIFTTKKRMSVISTETPTKKGETKKIKNIKSYLPLYLRKKLNSSVLSEYRKSDNELNVKKKETKPLIASIDAHEITKDLTNNPENISINNFMIFRNEVDIEKDCSNIQSQVSPGSIKNENCHSPQSQPSSTCSSPNSVATVRLVSTRNKVICNRSNSTSSDRSSSGILESENKTTKNKKFSRRGKTNKKPPQNFLSLCDNKENIPESSKNTFGSTKDIRKDTERNGKCPYLGRKKSMFMAQMTTESSSLPLTSTTCIPKSKMQYLNEALKLTDINNTNEPNLEQPTAPLLTSSVGKNFALDFFKTKDDTDNSSTCDTDSRDFSEGAFNKPSKESLENDTIHISNKAHRTSRKSIHTSKSSIISAIRELIENKLNLAENSTCDSNNSDSETVILNRDDIYTNSGDDSLSPFGLNTHNITQEVCSVENSQVQYSDVMAENESVPNVVNFQPLDTESDLWSLKSFASMSTSKLSEYYLADNELDTALPQVDTLDSNSVQDIFERQEQLIPNIGGLLALQALSGFSVNETIAGDQPNFVDSETGSYAFESARQAASEEIFVSGRSSDTYESCYVDDDAYVPHWLFNIISQQQSAEGSEVDEINLPIPMAEASFDMNGNMMGPEVGVGAGAGDGRGMHSDHSQDSSGRGTSLSSSDTSSGLQSEVGLNDPPTFTSQAEHLRETPLNMPATIGPSPRPEASPVPNVEGRSEDGTSYSQRIAINPTIIASDIDADVSSLDTDVVDSDN